MRKGRGTSDDGCHGRSREFRKRTLSFGPSDCVCLCGVRADDGFRRVLAARAPAVKIVRLDPQFWKIPVSVRRGSHNLTWAFMIFWITTLSEFGRRQFVAG